MKVYDLILKRRTIRSFLQKNIAISDIIEMVNAARLAPSSANLQPLEYIIITKNLEGIFKSTNWAGYLKDGAPKNGERPVAYILIITNMKINKESKYDVGLAAENIVLTALEKGIGSCIIGSLNREEIMGTLGIKENYNIELAVALGYPKQKSIVSEFKDSVKYWLDKDDRLHVPKRKIKSVIHEEKF